MEMNVSIDRNEEGRELENENGKASRKREKKSMTG